MDEEVATRLDQVGNHQRSDYEASRLAHIANWVQKTCENKRYAGGSSNRGSSSNLYCESYSVGNPNPKEQSISSNTPAVVPKPIPGATSAFPSSSFDKRPTLPQGFKDRVDAISTNLNLETSNSDFGQSKYSFRPLEDVLPKLGDA
ncbi:unnamed protein product [Allacma fusca]|uniref:Uncharacterized protein n=1 Tax=Allacma fusca TaxID=39272 RepID=A0A8J2JNN7_9HEXA|nr:unnamed protein product [Allacma fusca]